MRVTGPTGKSFLVTFTVTPEVARRGHLHNRRLAKVTLTKPGTALLRLGPKTRSALKKSKGQLIGVIAVTGPGAQGYAKTLTLHR